MDRHELLWGLETRELRVQYQPQWSTQRGAYVGVEALIRWQRDDGLLMPDAFLPAFERCGLSGLLGRYTLSTVCDHVRDLRASGITLDHVGVNFSCGQLAAEDFRDSIHRIIAAKGIDPSLLMFEITESETFDEIDRLAGLIRSLSSLGVRFALDDFCTGYSTLQHICHLPIDAMKIDKVFVSKLEEQRTQIVLEHLIEMAKRMQVETIAEGVETDDQIRELSRLGCHVMQGYYYAKAVDVDRLEELLTAPAPVANDNEGPQRPPRPDLRLVG